MNTEHPVVYFDGMCLICTGAVQFILKRDTRKRFRFATLQGEAGRNLLLKEGIPSASPDSFLLEWRGRVYQRSDAALLVCKLLGKGWLFLYGLIILPRFLRDGMYAWVARNRYRWFGKHQECWMPPCDWKDRLIN
jgi:predicted DCC family thiol-disulfide oxidoreductase YuxK